MSRRPAWADWPDERLLELPMNRLGLRIDGSAIQDRIDQLWRELAERGLRFRPHFWLGEDWFTPDGVPGIAIPFYLAHPRLLRLERAQMLQAEGASRAECMRILRHEAGHAIDNAYRLRLRRRRQELFGLSTKRYPTHYRPRPFSRHYVQHLNHWYAQSHPAEDFAETFAVWLRNLRPWRRQYEGWPALRKLEYVDELMREIAGRAPPVRSRERSEPLSAVRRTLGAHYAEKRRRYAATWIEFGDEDLRRLFSEGATYRHCEPAARFLRRDRGRLRRLVWRWTGEHQYALQQVIDAMIARCARLNLRRTMPERQAFVDCAMMLAVHTMNSLHGGSLRIAM